MPACRSIFLQMTQKFPDNRVITSKYTLLSFLPLNLIEQLKKASNIYFVIIMLMQTVNAISISGGKPAMLPPLIIVTAVSMIKDAYEDYCRHCKDREENNSRCLILKQGGHYEECKWHEVKVGDIIKVEENHYFPADLLIVESTGQDGLCYVETKNLDGETNMKHKIQASKIASIDSYRTIQCELPNKELYKFDGRALLANGQQPLTNDNVVLRGMSLRNTEYIVGVVIYTGNDTKIQRNSTQSKYKTSKLMQQTNLQILLIFLM